MRKRILSLLMVMAMALTMIPAISAPVLAATVTDTGAKFELVDNSDGSYKLVFYAKTPHNISFFNTIFSFDNTVIQPVRRNNHATDVTPVQDDDSPSGYQIVFQPVAEDSDMGDPFSTAVE